MKDWVIALDNRDGTHTVCANFPTKERADEYLAKVIPSDLKHITIVCTLSEAKQRNFLCTEHYDPRRTLEGA